MYSLHAQPQLNFAIKENRIDHPATHDFAIHRTIIINHQQHLKTMHSLYIYKKKFFIYLKSTLYTHIMHTLVINADDACVSDVQVDRGMREDPLGHRTYPHHRGIVGSLFYRHYPCNSPIMNRKRVL